MHRSLEELVISEGLLSREDAAAAADRAARSGASLVATLIASELVSESDLAEAIGHALDLPVVDLGGGELDDEAIHLIAADLAERRLLIPMGLDLGARVLRVALADPLDAEGIAELEAATGLSVAPMVATPSSIGRAIQRYYRSTTKVVAKHPARARDAAPTSEAEDAERPFGESTRRVAAARTDRETPGTAPSHSIEEEASVEMRLRALVQALEDRGVLTREDYLEALRRVLGER